MSDADREELVRLRTEVAELKAAKSKPARPGRSRRVGRTVVAIVLILLGCLLGPLSVVSVWARGEVTDTDRYVATVAPLASDPGLQQAVTTKITDKVFEYIDIEGLTTSVFTSLSQSDILPERVASQVPALAPLVADGIRSATESQVLKLVQSDVFADAWVQANRAAHEELVAALTGDTSGAVTVSGDAVSVSLGAFLATVKQQLISSGFQLAERIPVVDVQFVVFQSADLPKVQRAFDLLNTLGLWLPLVCAVLIFLGVYIAPNHRLAFIGAGFGVMLASLATALALAAVRRMYLEDVPSDVLPSSAAAMLFDTLVRNLRDGIRAAALLGLVVALGAFLTGPSTTATTLRRWIVALFALARGGLQRLGLGLEGVTSWLAPRAGVFRGAAVALAFAILLLQRYRTPELVFWLTVGVLAALALIQFLATPPRQFEPAKPAPAVRPGVAVPAQP